jgi:hypothetical protein
MWANSFFVFEIDVGQQLYIAAAPYIDMLLMG